jgi:hypothetical protein
VRSLAILSSTVLLAVTPAFAQQPADPHAQHKPQEHAGMALFPTREASGTAWLPEDTPMFGVMRTFGPWTAMFHGNAFGQVIYEPGEIHRTGGFSTTQASSVNWAMVMLRRPVGAGRLGFRGMASLEPATVPGCGYLNLLASGEVCDGDTIHDRQHPHDFIMELAAEYERPLTANVSWQVYGGLAGEPALGPVAFPHRLSALSNPIAPVAHHWLDSTHITFGVVTAALFGKTWKAESSVFNGREPDEHRWDLDLAAMDSFSGRFTYAPTPRLALQVSAGSLNEAEEGVGSHGRADVTRFTASSTYHLSDGGRSWATTLGYGVNSEREEEPTGAFDEVTHALMLESNLMIGETHTWFGRAEIAGKSAHDLHAHEFPGRIFTVGKVQAGYARSLQPWKGFVPAVGGSFTLNFVPEALDVQYQGRVRPGFAIFLSLRPPRHQM